jgi:hypothetical protein
MTTRSVPRQPAREITVQTFATTVAIRPADPAKGRDVKLARHTTVRYSNGTLHIACPAGYQVLGSTGAVEVTVCLPARSRVAALTIHATTTIGDITAESR